MIRKNPKDYIKEITILMNEDPPVNGYIISESEVKEVLTYFLKNFAKVIQRNDNMINFDQYLFFMPNIRDIVRHKARMRKKLGIYKKRFFVNY